MSKTGVPMFEMKPKREMLWASVIVLVLGGATYLDGHLNPGNIIAQDRSNLFLAISIVISGILVIIATSRMWFRHLWHDRYKK